MFILNLLKQHLKEIYKKHKKYFNLDGFQTDIKLSNSVEESSHV